MNLIPLSVKDIDVVEHWLNKPHVRHFFGEPIEWIEEIKSNINLGWVHYFLIEHDGKKIGFTQYYITSQAPAGEWSSMPLNTIGIDYVIGEEEYLNKGYGTKIIKLLIDEIKNQKLFDFIIADPNEENLKSVTVLEKNGFLQLPNGLYCLKISNDNITLKHEKGNTHVKQITQLFYNTIQHINSKDYPKDEIDDWASWHIDFEGWGQRINEQFFITAWIDNELEGFSSIAPDGYLDFMFIHKNFQRHGIASKLLKGIENKAILHRNKYIYSDVSLTARDFFEKQGYIVEKQQLKKSREKELINFRMIKEL